MCPGLLLYLGFLNHQVALSVYQRKVVLWDEIPLMLLECSRLASYDDVFAVLFARAGSFGFRPARIFAIQGYARGGGDI